MKVVRWLFAVWLVSLVFIGADAERKSSSVESASLPPEDTLAASTGPVDLNGLYVRASALVSQLTGPESPARTDEPWNIYGTDLGFSIEHDGKIYVVFGDTWGREDSEGADWRSNTMALVEPHPEYGYIITEVIEGENGEAKELLPSLKEPEKEYTAMPTAGIAVGDRMYLHYLSVKDWDHQWWDYKEPVANGSGLAYSDDGGHTWAKADSVWWEGNSPFAQAALATDEDGEYVYVYGTPAGRFGALKLFRVPGEDLLDPSKYEYWDGAGWSSDPYSLADVVPAPVGELSVRWSPYHERWLMMYLNEVDHTIVLRTAERPEGPWDAERVVVTDAEYPTLYAPMLLPITGADVYFTMSTFKAYQVFVMRFTLEAV